jgi:PAS domain S-box-containing protein
MSVLPVRFKTALTVLLTGLLVLVGVLNLRARAAWTDPWDGVFWEESGSRLRAGEVAALGPAAPAGILPGDLLVAINDQPVRDLGHYFTLLDELGIHAEATYTLLDPGSQAERRVSLRIGARELLGPRDAIWIVLALLHLGIGLFVIVHSGRSPRAYHFFLICLAAFVVFLYSYTSRLDSLDLLVYWADVVGFLLLPAMFVHFCMRFPVDRVAGHTRAPLVYIPVALLAVGRLLWLTGRLAGLGLPATAASSQRIDRFDLVYFCAGFLIAAALLWRRSVLAEDLTTRQQMKWVAWGTLFGAVPFTLVYAVPFLLGARPTLLMEMAALSLGLIPLAFAYAIIHYRLLDVEAIVRRGAAYFIASSILLALYLLLVLVLSKTLEWIVPEAGFLVVTVAALAIALLFAPVRGTIQARLDRFFYKDQFDDRTSLLEFGRMLSTEISLGRLARRILERVSRTFGIESAALLLKDPARPGFFRLTDELGADAAAAGTPVLLEERQAVEAAIPNGASRADGANELHRAGAPLRARGLHYVQDLSLRGRRIGVIALGPLPRRAHFSTEDLDLLGALSGYAAMALENASLYRSLEVKALELERLKVYTENIIESINVAVLVLDLEGNVTSCNRAFEELYHAHREVILGSPVTTLLPADFVASIHDAAGTTAWQIRETTNLHKLYLANRRGENLIVNASLVPMVDEFDQTTGCILVLDDVSQKIHLEDQLLQAEKLSSIGLLAAGIAHEVNTPITGISSFTQMLLKQTAEDDRRRPILEKIEKQTFRAAEIVNGLLNFARMNGSDYADLDVNQLIQESLSLVDHQLHSARVQVDVELDGSLPRVYGNSGKLQQVFVNLFLNARDAMPPGGSMRVQTSMNETMVLVDIRDTGVGISQDDIKRIYDPFFTTKSTGKGTGLGLAVTYGIIQEHGGRIFVDSVPGQGTHFRLKLPTRQNP